MADSEPAPVEAVGECDRERITHTNQLQSPLLRLPAEIKNNIYHHVFEEIPVKVYLSWDIPRLSRIRSSTRQHCVVEDFSPNSQRGLRLVHVNRHF